ncbi:hypothetical protein L208DRAFT_1058274, partial [Tricholoma matsutake]
TGLSMPSQVLFTVSTHITRFFTLTMQSGAFLQLVLTVLALVSRLGTISFEVLEALQ